MPDFFLELHFLVLLFRHSNVQSSVTIGEKWEANYIRKAEMPIFKVDGDDGALNWAWVGEMKELLNN